MSKIRTWTITFRKSIRDKGDGEYGTPCTKQLAEFINGFCELNHIEVDELSLQDPFKDSHITITGPRERRDELFAYLKGLERQFIVTTVIRK